LSIDSNFARFVPRAVLALILPLLLLAQHGAWLHALSHTGAQSLTATGHQDSGHDRQTKACGLCLAFAPFDGAAPTPGFAAALPTEGVTSIRAVVRQCVLRCAAHAYLSRAPPDLA